MASLSLIVSSNSFSRYTTSHIDILHSTYLGLSVYPRTWDIHASSARRPPSIKATSSSRLGCQYMAPAAAYLRNTVKQPGLICTSSSVPFLKATSPFCRPPVGPSHLLPFCFQNSYFIYNRWSYFLVRIGSILTCVMVSDAPTAFRGTSDCKGPSKFIIIMSVCFIYAISAALRGL